MENIKERILADAIEQYIKSERYIIKLRRENKMLMALLSLGIAFFVWYIIKQNGG